MSDALIDILEVESTKNKIFMVAAHLIAEKGYHGVSMRELSEKSGVSKPTIYYYFNSKEGIYKELLDAAIVHLDKQLRRIQSLQIPAKSKLIEFVKMSFQQCAEYPEFVKMLLDLSNRRDEIPFIMSFRSEFGRKDRIIAEIIQEGIESGEFGANANPELAAEIINGVVVHFFWRQVGSNRRLITEGLAEEIIEMLFRGLNE
ncbi:TetR/AcrR family transcriptional regulator [candidate division KSB1 bacterium]|nr:TetR/AcrR family transcriptional regulator [candidate division KSB1 bacterium]